MDPHSALEPGQRLCSDCLELGGACPSCVRALLPRIATNRRWLKLMATARYQAALAAPDPAVAAEDRRAARAENRAARKAAELETARAMRITTLIAGGFARASHHSLASLPA